MANGETVYTSKVELQQVLPSEPVPVAPREHPNGHGEVLVIRDGYRVHVVEGRTCGKRAHAFDDLASFADWLNRHAADDANGCEILVGDELVKAALAPPDPHGDLVTCSLAEHPTFAAWEAAFGEDLPQAFMHRLVIANAESLGENAAAFGTALLQLRLATQGAFDAELSPLGYMKVVGGTNRQEATVQLPPAFTVTTPIFDGVHQVVPAVEGETRAGIGAEATYALEVFLTLKVVGEAADKRAVFRLDCPGLSRAKRQARRDAAAYLAALLDPGFLVGLGAVQLHTVPAVD